MSRSQRLILSLFIGFIVSHILTFFFGESGYIALQQIKGYENRLIQNNTELANTNRSLAYQLHRLQSDPELIQLYARKLGYFKGDEYTIRIEGIQRENNFYSVGKMIKPPKKSGEKKPLIRSISCGVTIGFYLLLGMMRKMNNGGKKNRVS